MKVKQDHKIYSLDVSSGEESLLEFLIERQIDISHSCGGNGTCGTCRVNIEKGLEILPPRNELELEMAEERGFKPFERLSCQIIPNDDLEILIP